MKKVDITFSIKSLDSDVHFNCIGEFKNQRLKFVDEDKNTNYIIFKNNGIEYYKKGNVFMKYVFQLNTETSGLYQVMGNEFVFKIITKSIITTPKSLHVEFELYQDNSLVNKSTLDVVYQEE